MKENLEREDRNKSAQILKKNIKNLYLEKYYKIFI